jgi:hypothetical protein
MKKSNILFSFFIGLFAFGTAISGQSQDNTIGSDSAKYSQPLADKKFGIGIDPIRTVVYIGYELQLKGAISLFSIDRHAEIAFPVQYLSGEAENRPYSVFYCEAAYRRFFSEQQKGFYYSGGIRFAYIQGEILDDTAEPGSPEAHTGINFEQNKVGIYAGIGYRHFYKNGFYFGSNVILGTYFGPKAPFIQTTEDMALNFILGGELFQIGYAF